MSQIQEHSWFVAGYPLTVGSFILPFGRVEDSFGYKRLFILRLCWFSFWSMAAGVSTDSNYVLFIFARVIQGEFLTSFGDSVSYDSIIDIGPAICLPNAVAIKNIAFAVFGAIGKLRTR